MANRNDVLLISIQPFDTNGEMVKKQQKAMNWGSGLKIPHSTIPILTFMECMQTECI
jgi:hypothetical protein